MGNRSRREPAEHHGRANVHTDNIRVINADLEELQLAKYLEQKGKGSGMITQGLYAEIVELQQKLNKYDEHLANAIRLAGNSRDVRRPPDSTDVRLPPDSCGVRQLPVPRNVRPLSDSCDVRQLPNPRDVRLPPQGIQLQRFWTSGFCVE